MGEYLAAASKEAGPDKAGDERYRGWKDKLLVGGAKEVIAELAGLHGKEPEKEEVETCLRYLSNRADHLDYAKALDDAFDLDGGISGGVKFRRTDVGQIGSTDFTFPYTTS